jgi:hypothetical protein
VLTVHVDDPGRLGFLHSRDVLLGRGRRVELWDCPCASGALERVSPPNEWENVTHLQDHCGGTLYLMKPALPGWPESEWLCCSVMFGTSMHPDAMAWDEQGLPMVTTTWTCWAIEVPCTEVAFRFRLERAYPRLPEVFPDGQRLLLNDDQSLECITPRGETLWSCPAKPPSVYQILPDGDVYLRYYFDGERRAKRVDGRTGEVHGRGHPVPLAWVRPRWLGGWLWRKLYCIEPKRRDG